MKPQYIKISELGSKYYYSDKEMTILHREDGPAGEWSDGSKWWFIDDKLHREDGPAIEFASGTREWYLNDVQMTEAEFKAKKVPHNGKKVTVDGIEYTLKA